VGPPIVDRPGKSEVKNPHVLRQQPVNPISILPPMIGSFLLHLAKGKWCTLDPISVNFDLVINCQTRSLRNYEKSELLRQGTRNG
jgi:hypothetical protein